MNILMLAPDVQMIDRRILQEARTLSAAGHRVTVLSGFECLTADAYEDGPIRVKRYTYDWTDRRRARFMRGVPARVGRLAWPVVRRMADAMGRPDAFETFVLEKVLEHEFDVIHVHDFPMLRVGYLAARARGARLVYDSHEFYPVQACFPPETQRRYLARERSLVRECDVVITVNPYIARMMGDAHGIAPPHVILNACERPAALPEIGPEERRRARAAAGLPPDAFLLIYQGWISAERNLETMVRAMVGQAEDVHLAVVGYGVHLDTLRALARDLGVEGRISFLGRIENERLAALTRLCDLGVIPYKAVDEMHRYCSPNKLYEFVASGIPILATDLPYLRDVIGGYGIGRLGRLDDAGEFAALVRALRSDPEALAAMRRNLPRALDELNWEVEGAKLLGLYARLARPEPAGSGLPMLQAG